MCWDSSRGERPFEHSGQVSLAIGETSDAGCCSASLHKRLQRAGPGRFTMPLCVELPKTRCPGARIIYSMCISAQASKKHAKLMCCTHSWKR